MSAEQKAIGKTKIAGRLERNFTGGQSGCPGCQAGVVGIIVNELLAELELNGIVIGVTGIGCARAGVWAYQNVDIMGGAHGRAADYALAIKHVYPDAFVLTTQGDGDCLAIGMGATVNAASRGEKFTMLMTNNASYGSTGGQMAPTTPLGAWTTTSPLGREPVREGYGIHGAELLAALPGVAYSARAAVNTPAHRQSCKQYIRTAFTKQINKVGFSFVEVLLGCPTNRRLTPLEALKWVEEVQIPQFPLGEFKNVDRIG